MATTAEQRSRQLDPGPLITLYTLTPKGAAPFYFHDGISQGNNNVVFAGKTYVPYPIKAEGFEWSTKGTMPRPTFTVSNIGSVVSALLREYNDFVGAMLTVTRTFAAFIQGGSEPNPNQHFPIERYQVQRKTAENNTVCTFELSMPIDAESVVLPRRQILAHTCIWVYRGADCGYAGVPKQDRLGTTFATDIVDKGQWVSTATYAYKDFVWVLDNGVRVYFVSKVNGNLNNPPNPAGATDDDFWWMDFCLKRQQDCELHFGAANNLPTSAFPGCYKIS